MADGERIEELLDYLPEDEKIVSNYKIGFYDVVTTTERLICLKKFPRSFVEVSYGDIDNLEHLTRILWRELLDAVILLGVSLFIYFNDMGKPFIEPIESILSKYLPEVANLVPVELLVHAVMSVTAVVGLYHFIRFIPSLQGYFRISRKGRAPVIIHTSLTPQLKNLIREIEERVREKGKEAGKPIVIQTGAPQEEAKSPEEAVKSKLAAEAGGMKENAVILISSKSKDHGVVVSNMLDILVNEKDMGGIYISVSRPYEFIVSMMKEKSISSDDIYFVDCISQMAGKAHDKPDENVVFVENPSSLEEVSLYLDRMLGKVKNEKKFLFLDSLSSLLIYNNDKSVKEFTHFIINKIRLENIAGVILSIEKKEAEDLVRTLTPMCDAEIRF